MNEPLIIDRQQWSELHKKIRALELDNLRLSNLVTKFDTALRTIAAEAGMTEAYSGVDTEEQVDRFVKAVKGLKSALKASKNHCGNCDNKKYQEDSCDWYRGWFCYEGLWDERGNEDPEGEAGDVFWSSCKLRKEKS